MGNTSWNGIFPYSELLPNCIIVHIINSVEVVLYLFRDILLICIEKGHRVTWTFSFFTTGQLTVLYQIPILNVALQLQYHTSSFFFICSFIKKGRFLLIFHSKLR